MILYSVLFRRTKRLQAHALRAALSREAFYGFLHPLGFPGGELVKNSKRDNDVVREEGQEKLNHRPGEENNA